MLAMREGVMSAAFDVIWHGYKSGLKSSVGGKPDEDSAELFDKVRMENVYAGHGKENGEVLCTVEFGMVCTRRVVKEVNKANGVNGVNGAERPPLRQRMGSRSLPFMTDILGNSLNDRLLFAVPKSTFSTISTALRTANFCGSALCWPWMYYATW